MTVSVVSFGSLNHDLAVWLPHTPRADETIRADRFAEFRGGKGANQAVAAARAGASVAMVGAVGADARGDMLLAGLAADGVDHTHVARLPGVPTGTAIPIITAGGEVSIIIVAGANGALTAAHADAAASTIEAADVLLLQGEVPGEAAGRAAAIARAAGRRVVYNPAPVNDVAEHVLPYADVVVMNRDEAALLGARVTAPLVVTTLGAEGALVGGHRVAAFHVPVVDPTGAGDAFVAMFAVALAEGHDPIVAARMGCAAGALAVQVAGAEPSMPRREAIDALLHGDRP